MLEALDVVAVVVAGLMVGNELAIAAVVHPTLNRLPDGVHLSAASALVGVLGKVMPFWYVSVILLTSADAWVRWHQSARLPSWVVAPGVLWLLAIINSLTVEIPINNGVASWVRDAPPAEWKTVRNRWDLHHRWRVVLLTIAFAPLVVGVVTQ